MNSLKNTIVIVLLLGVSYGVYQVVNVPEAEPLAAEDDVQLEIEDSVDDESFPEMASDDQATGELPKGFDPPSPLPSSPPVSKNPLSDDQLPPQGFSPLPDQPPSLLPNDNNAFEDSKKLVDVSKPNDFPKQNPNELPNTGFATTQDPPTSGTNEFPNDLNSGDVFAGNNAFENQPSNEFKINTNPEPTGPSENDFRQAMNSAQAMIDQQDFKGALVTLSKFYNVNLSQSNRTILLNFLDSLAGKVIYSQHHLLTGTAHIVQRGETLQSIAQSWNVPAQLVYNVNRSKIQDPQNLLEGTELKRVNGPFKADISVEKKEMTMFVGDMYAGRFAINLGNDVQVNPGRYVVQKKSDQGRSYQDKSGQVIGAGAVDNPYGQFWMDLGGGLSIHSRGANQGMGDDRGCIQIENMDAPDVFGILSQNSEVIIRR